MLNSLMTLVVFVLLVGLAVWLIRALIAAFEISEPLVTLIYVVLVLVVLFALARATGFDHSRLLLRL